MEFRSLAGVAAVCFECVEVCFINAVCLRTPAALRGEQSSGPFLPVRKSAIAMGSPLENPTRCARGEQWGEGDVTDCVCAAGVR